MPTVLASYADASFRTSQQRLTASASSAGIACVEAWDRARLEGTSFYRLQRAILDQRRGGGYWLWKPFIIKETLRSMAEGDLLVYADAGIEIVADLSPLFALAAHQDILLFVAHYDDAGAPGPNTCGKWTKRDCFLFMDCDEPRFHQAPMVDASFLILKNGGRARAFVREWLLLCCQEQLLTDTPSVCGVPALAEQLGHQHDQSLLSLLAHREGLELFRHPSQWGNHAKAEAWRQPGEWTRHPYGAKGIYANSPYPTLLNQHRGHLGQTDLRVSLQRRVPAAREAIFTAWTQTDILARWQPPELCVLEVDSDGRPGGRYHLRLGRAGTRGRSVPPLDISGTYLQLDRPSRLLYDAPAHTQVSVELRDTGAGTEVLLEHGDFRSEQICEQWTALWNSFLDHLTIELVPPLSGLDDASSPGTPASPRSPGLGPPVNADRQM
jgi:uncharacterized protein YndB with AHSA1/START domain